MSGRLHLVPSVPDLAPSQKLEQIVALLGGQAKITPAMLRIKIRAICEGIDVPAERKAFIALAVRAGVSQPRRYDAWHEFHPSARRPPVPAMPPTALYRYFDADDLLLYVGITDELPGRIGTHAKRSLWMNFAARSTIERFAVREVAETAEEAAIGSERPIFNKLHNSTPEAKQRVIDYLAEHGRLDLLPLWK